MKINWIIEKNVFENENELVEELSRQGSNYIFAPRNVLRNKDLTCIFPNSCVVYHGGLHIGYKVRRETKLVPGVYASVENYKCSEYYPKFGPFLLNSEYAILPYGDIKRQKDWLYGSLGSNDTIFIRPNKGTKPFIGKTIEYTQFEKDLEDIKLNYSIKPNELCVISTPKNIDKEWRFLVVDNKVVAGSLYHPDIEDAYQSTDPDTICALHFAVNLLNPQLMAHHVTDVEYQPDRAWVLDICMTSNKYTNYQPLHVLEVGCFSCACLYGMNMECVVSEINDIAKEDWKDCCA